MLAAMKSLPKILLLACLTLGGCSGREYVDADAQAAEAKLPQPSAAALALVELKLGDELQGWKMVETRARDRIYMEVDFLKGELLFTIQVARRDRHQGEPLPLHETEKYIVLLAGPSQTDPGVKPVVDEILERIQKNEGNVPLIEL